MWARRRRRWTTRPVLPVGFEPTVSALSERRALRCSAGVVRGMGIEPTSLAWKARVLPLNEPRIELAAAAGIEPAIVWLTASRLTIRPHRKKVGQVGFEPTYSS